MYMLALRILVYARHCKSRTSIGQTFGISGINFKVHQRIVCFVRHKSQLELHPLDIGLSTHTEF